MQICRLKYLFIYFRLNSGPYNNNNSNNNNNNNNNIHERRIRDQYAECVIECV